MNGSAVVFSSLTISGIPPTNGTNAGPRMPCARSCRETRKGGRTKARITQAKRQMTRAETPSHTSPSAIESRSLQGPESAIARSASRSSQR